MCLVRFPDGELMAAYFFGGPEVVVPLLFPLDSADEVFAGGMEPLMERLEADDDRPEPFDTEPVQIWSAYGATFWWEGRASKGWQQRWAIRRVKHRGTSTTARPTGCPTSGDRRTETRWRTAAFTRSSHLVRVCP
jgi:hypothetical protein